MQSYSVDESVELIAQIHRQLESIEDYRLKLKWWMGYVLRHTHAPHGTKTEVINRIVKRLREAYAIRASRSLIYECVKLYDGMRGDYSAFLSWIEHVKKTFGRPAYWYDVQRDLLGGRNNPEVIGREEADRRDFLDAERAIEAIESIVIRANEGNEEAAGVLEAVRQSIQGLLLLGERTPRTPRSEKYLQFVASYSCLVCGQISEPHHAIGKRGTGLKPSDFGCVPLCRAHHDDFHRVGRRPFEDRYDVNLAESALNLLHRYVTGSWLTSPLRLARPSGLQRGIAG